MKTETRALNILVLSSVTLLMSCGGQPNDSFVADADFHAARDACLSAYPGTDAQIPVQVCPAGPPGSPPNDCSDMDAGDSAITQCLSEVDDCVERDAIITMEAAKCIALESGLPAGLFPLRASLVYHHGLQKVVWNVTAQTSGESDRGCGSGGPIRTLDAETGIPSQAVMHQWQILC